MSQTLLSLACFQVILIGRSWVIAEADQQELQKLTPKPALGRQCKTWTNHEGNTGAGRITVHSS